MIIREHLSFLIPVFLISVVIRLFIFCNFTCYGSNAWIYVDSEQYDTIARNICNGNGIAFKVSEPQYYRVPGYPLFLALLYKLTQCNINRTLFVQSIFTSLIPILLFFLSLTLLPGEILVAKVSAVIAMLHLGFILYASMLATETLCILLLLIFFILFFVQQRSAQYMFFAGIALGCASLCRPLGHYLVVLTILMLFFMNPLEKFLKKSTLLTCGWLIPVVPWLVRNYMLTGFLFFHSLPGLHFLQYMAAPIVMQEQHCSYPKARSQVLAVWNARIHDVERAHNRSLNEYEKCCIGEKLAWSYVIKNPEAACRRVITEITKTCFGLYSAIILLADGAVWPDYGQQVTLWKKMQRFLFPSVRRSWLIGFIYSEIMMMLLLMIGLCLYVWQMICQELSKLNVCRARPEEPILSASRRIRALEWFETSDFAKATTYSSPRAQTRDTSREIKSAVIDGTTTRVLALKIVPYIMLFIGLTLAYGGARLRMPADPLLIIAAVYGWIATIKQRAWRGKNA